MLYREVLAGRRDAYQVEKRYIQKGGGIIWGHLTVSIVKGTDGKMQYAVSMVEDITEHKRITLDLVRQVAQMKQANRTHPTFLQNPDRDIAGAVCRDHFAGRPCAGSTGLRRCLFCHNTTAIRITTTRLAAKAPIRIHVNRSISS